MFYCNIVVLYNVYTIQKKSDSIQIIVLSIVSKYSE